MNLSKNGKKLKEYISSFSERWFCAGWRVDIENYIWSLGKLLPTDAGTINMAIRIYEANLIVEKANDFGIWLYWDNRENKLKEVSLYEWIVIYKERYEL